MTQCVRSTQWFITLSRSRISLLSSLNNNNDNTNNLFYVLCSLAMFCLLSAGLHDEVNAGRLSFFPDTGDSQPRSNAFSSNKSGEGAKLGGVSALCCDDE